MILDEILKMSAGREMDELIATKIMGLFVLRDFQGERIIVELIQGDPESSFREYLQKPELHYSTDIRAAWELMEKYSFAIWKNGDSWAVGNTFDEQGFLQDAEAPSAPLAICRAALLAVMDTK